MKKPNSVFESRRTYYIEQIVSRLLADADLPACPRHLADELGTTESWIEFWVEEARMDGHLVLENEDGYYLAPTYEDFDQWRKDTIIPRLTRELDKLHAMGKQAKEQFHLEQGEGVLPFLAG
jgi:hypothetical protein